MLGVEGMAVLLARRWGLDEGRVLLAALLHDIAKSWPRERQRQALDAVEVVTVFPEDLAFPAVWHGLAGAQEARDAYGVDDQEVIEAVAYHPTGNPGLGRVGLALYIADFVEPSRDWPGVEAFRALAMSAADPRDAARRIAEAKQARLEIEGRAAHPRTRRMAEWLAEETAAASAAD